MKIFLDSGAYSAYRNKTSINIQEYIDFIKENEKDIETYANLDDIGSPEGTWKNQVEMERQGLSPIPVYHLGEPTNFLDRAIAYPYFAVGGIASKLTSYGALGHYLHTVFSKVCLKKNDYVPSNKVHGFGIANPKLLIRYPWYSADTTSWVQYGRYGIILVPGKQMGKFRYDIPPYTITVSSRSKATGDAKHLNNFPDMIKEVIVNYCNELGFPIGKTLTKVGVPAGYVLAKNEKWLDKDKKDEFERIIEVGLCCSGEMRDKINRQYFLDLEKNQPEWPWSWPNDVDKLEDDQQLF